MHQALYELEKAETRAGEAQCFCDERDTAQREEAQARVEELERQLKSTGAPPDSGDFTEQIQEQEEEIARLKSHIQGLQRGLKEATELADKLTNTCTNAKANYLRQLHEDTQCWNRREQQWLQKEEAQLVQAKEQLEDTVRRESTREDAPADSIGEDPSCEHDIGSTRSTSSHRTTTDEDGSFRTVVRMQQIPDNPKFDGGREEDAETVED